eukprot:TRINITY_DN4241_c7_g1_i1.p1 TRINITY_DN4241_c7_g1~~TRINITY_DN4241_c7_g1_i1.p1  ORF type:complete len:239 (+),score=51.73 TRINITY_DN4241_c7_g1_i1:31-747(+)
MNSKLLGGGVTLIITMMMMMMMASANGGAVPGELINLKGWALQLPTGPESDPTMITQPKLNTFVDPPYFYGIETQDTDFVVFLAYVNGSHTGGSEYPRTELSERLKWSTSSGYNNMTVTHAYTHVPKKRPEIVGGQILCTGGPIMQIRLNTPNIVVYGGPSHTVIYPNYALGTVITYSIIATDGNIKVYLNGEEKVSWAHSEDNCYYKAGAYVQSNLNYDDETQYGEVQMYDVTVDHS